MASSLLQAPGQLCLPGFAAVPPEPPRQPRHNLFFAVKLEEPTRGHVLAMRSDLQLAFDLRKAPVAPERLHMTLFPVASSDEPPRQELVHRARNAAAEVEAAVFALELDRVLSFRRGDAAKPLVLTPRRGHEPFVALQRRLSLAVGAAGLHARAHGFGSPHVTLTYDRDIERELEIPPIRLEAREFAFIHSHRGQSRHELLGRWQLRA